MQQSQIFCLEPFMVKLCNCTTPTFMYKQINVYSSCVINLVLISFSYSDYIDNASNNHITKTLSRNDNFFNNNCTYQLTTCAKLVTDTKGLRGVVCVEHTVNSVVRIN